MDVNAQNNMKHNNSQNSRLSRISEEKLNNSADRAGLPASIKDVPSQEQQSEYD